MVNRAVKKLLVILFYLFSAIIWFAGFIYILSVKKPVILNIALIPVYAVFAVGMFLPITYLLLIFVDRGD